MKTTVQQILDENYKLRRKLDNLEQENLKDRISLLKFIQSNEIDFDKTIKALEGFLE